jgi:hypothetical protein
MSRTIHSLVAGLILLLPVVAETGGDRATTDLKAAR